MPKEEQLKMRQATAEEERVKAAAKSEEYEARRARDRAFRKEEAWKEFGKEFCEERYEPACEKLIEARVEEGRKRTQEWYSDKLDHDIQTMRKSNRILHIILCALCLLVILYHFEVTSEKNELLAEHQQALQTITTEYEKLRENYYAYCDQVVLVYDNDLYYHTMLCPEFRGIDPIGFFDMTVVSDMGYRGCPLCWSDYEYSHPTAYELLHDFDVSYE